MQEISKEKRINGDFEEIINKQSDNEILEVLRKRRYYQSAAVESALYEAIKRGLIDSEEDLKHPEFEEEPLKRTLFPRITDRNVRERIRKSLGRNLIIAGVLPLIFGFLQINEGETAAGILLLTFTLIWGFFSARIMLKGRKLYADILLGLTVVSAVYAVFFFQGLAEIVFMDVFIVAVLYLLIFYGLLYLRRLI